MEFFSNGTWWALFGGSCVTFGIYTFARRKGSSAPTVLNVIGFLSASAALALVILAFVWLGWIAGLALLVGMVIVVSILAALLRF